MSAEGLTVGVDVGGTKIAAGVVDEQGRVLAEVRRATPSHDVAQIAAAIADTVDELRREHEVVAVGVGAAGYIDADRSRVLFAPNLRWRDEPLRDEVAGRVGLPVVVENDANAAGWAEYRFGAGQGERDLVLLTLGTGVGGAIVLDGRLSRGRFGIGAEFGHYRVVPGGRWCGCGNRGCFEQYASGRALTRSAQEIATESPLFGYRLLEAGGGSPAGIDGRAVTAAARQGDAAALSCFDELAGWLGQGLADLAAVLDPGAFLIGGGLVEAADLFLDQAAAVFGRSLTGRGHRPVAGVRVAALGNDAGMIGAADLARQD